MNRTIDDLIAALGNLCSQAITEGDYDPENDIIRDPFCRNVNEVAGLVISELEKMNGIIAAAPALLVACKAALGTIEHRGDGKVSLPLIRAAIKAAESLEG